jgi:hypothetical protein
MKNNNENFYPEKYLKVILYNINYKEWIMKKIIFYMNYNV